MVNKVDAQHPPIEGSGFVGYISQINVWDRVLDPGADIAIMSVDRTQLVEDGLVLRWDNYGVDAGCSEISPSTAGDDVCDVGFEGPECTTPVPSKARIVLCLCIQRSNLEEFIFYIIAHCLQTRAKRACTY